MFSSDHRKLNLCLLVPLNLLSSSYKFFLKYIWQNFVSHFLCTFFAIVSASDVNVKNFQMKTNFSCEYLKQKEVYVHQYHLYELK
jgi:hypothetical protein